MKSIEEKIELHRSFLDRKNDKPLTGCIRGWENLDRYVEDTESFYPKGEVLAGDFTGERFLPVYESWTEKLQGDDDLFRTLETLPFFPWTEAAAGCKITYTGKNFWASGSGELLQHTEDGTWLLKYREQLVLLADRYGSRIPIGQSILRGPLDMAAAVFGEERMIFMFYDHPSLIMDFLTFAADIFLGFIDAQHELTPPFAGGQVIGSYYLWTPGTNLRLQEDAMALLSPDLYREFVHPVDCRIASQADYTLFHLHATGLHLLDILLENTGITILQVSKDEGVALEPMLPDLKKIQTAGKCLLLKGRFSREEFGLIRKNLNAEGLCIQAVITTRNEEEDFLEAF